MNLATLLLFVRFAQIHSVAKGHFIHTTVLPRAHLHLKKLAAFLFVCNLNVFHKGVTNPWPNFELFFGNTGTLGSSDYVLAPTKTTKHFCVCEMYLYIRSTCQRMCEERKRLLYLKITILLISQPAHLTLNSWFGLNVDDKQYKSIKCRNSYYAHQFIVANLGTSLKYCKGISKEN